jgi:hypothetical protein
MSMTYLQREHGTRLEAQISFVVLSDLAYQSLEGQLAQQQIGRFLVATNLAQCDRACNTRMICRR